MAWVSRRSVVSGMLAGAMGLGLLAGCSGEKDELTQTTAITPSGAKEKVVVSERGDVWIVRRVPIRGQDRFRVEIRGYRNQLEPCPLCKVAVQNYAKAAETEQNPVLPSGTWKSMDQEIK